MAKIKYVGLKQDGETAFSRETGITWFPGVSEEVPDGIAKRMLNHPDVFELDAAQVAAKPGKVTLQPMAPAVATTPVPTLPATEPITETQVSTDPANITLVPGQEVKPAEQAIDLAAMDKEALHALAKERGVKVHHNAGADTVRKALTEAQQ